MEIRSFDFTRDWSQYCSLHHETAGRPMDQVFIKWKYLDSPAGTALACGAWDDGRLVGFAALLPQKFCVQGGEHLAGMGEDLVARNRDRDEIVFRLTEKLLDEMNGRGWLWRYCVADGKNCEVYLNRLGHRRAAEILYLTKVRPGNMIRRMLGLRGKHKETTGFRMAYHSYKVRMVREFDERFDLLWERTKAEHPISVVKNAEYLNWRYVKHPTDHHQVLTVEDQGRLKGFAVLRGGDLLELFCEVDTDAYKTMAKAVEKVWRPAGEGSSRALVMGDRLAAVALEKAGWKDRAGVLGTQGSRFKKALAVLPNPGAEKGILGAKGGNWRLSMGDIIV